MNRSAQGCLTALAALALAACSLTPQLQMPALDMPSSFKNDSEGQRWQPARMAEAQPRGQWWLVFEDPALNALIEQAGAANQSLAVAAARVNQARALAGLARSEGSIGIDAVVGAQRGQASLDTPQKSFQARLSASYELDLFGRVGAGVNAARADAGAAAAAYRSVLLSLQADVAQTYFRLRESDAELATLERAVELRRQSVQVNQSRYDNGEIGEFDLARAQTELAGARAEAIGLQRQRAQQEHALAVLLGTPAPMFDVATRQLGDMSRLPAIPAGVPSQLLERRPDISAAQRALVAANERIGVARAAMFPALTLNAGFGSDAASSSSVFDWSARSWVLGALMSVPLIDGGRNRARMAGSEAVLEESVAAYRHNVLLAFAEVEDNLAGLRILAAQAEQVDAALLSARRSAELADTLYQAGHSSYLDLLDARRNLAAVERSAVRLHASRALTTVALIRSLGGGWESAASL